MNQKQTLLGVVVLLSVLLAFRSAEPGKFDGAWRYTNASGATVLMTLEDNYLVLTTYEKDRFIGTRGGVYKLDGENIHIQVEFDSQDSSKVGQTESYLTFDQGKHVLMRDMQGNPTFEKITETPTELTGLWRITGRANDAGQITTMQRGPRKTLKMLTGSRFQWIAINPQTKQFSGTGGGTYTLKDGKYTETIDFFSRDNSRVGKSLTFDAKVSGDQWNHSGESSTGGKVNEVWSREK
ncbi:hypothetical protein GCM10028807_45870 [Spirosoma daeguense]